MSLQETMMRVMESELQNKGPMLDSPDEITSVISEKNITLKVKRIYDSVFSALALIGLIPLFVIVGILIKIDSPGPVFYRQIRIGKDGRSFFIYKFRKMREDVGDGGSKLTLAHDQRMTRFGAYLRKTKLDEIPQLINVLKGDMGFVGPRPETPEYVTLYTTQQRQVLKVRPGITDYASLYFIDEGDLLEQVAEPEKYYKEILMPQKIRLNLRYIRNMSFSTDMKIIYLTTKKIFSSLGR